MIEIAFLLFHLLSPWSGGGVETAGAPDAGALQIQHALWKPAGYTLHADQDSVPEMDHLSALYGISLSDNLEKVSEQHGDPDEVSIVEGYTEYRYGDLLVGMFEDQVYYVSRINSPKEIELNGVVFPLSPFWIDYYLGDPDLVADDGDVYIRGSSALKLFRDESGRIISADLFDDSAS